MAKFEVEVEVSRTFIKTLLVKAPNKEQAQNFVWDNFDCSEFEVIEEYEIDEEELICIRSNRT